MSTPTPTTPEQDLASALSYAVDQLSDPVRKRLATWAGYGTTAAGAAAWGASQLPNSWHLPPAVQITLLTVAGSAGIFTGLGRMLQAHGRRKALATTVAAALAPLPPPGSGAMAPVVVLPTAGQDDTVDPITGLPPADGQVA